VKLRSGYNAVLWAIEHQCERADSIAAQKVEKEFGVSARLRSHILGPFMLWMARREERRLQLGIHVGQAASRS
jgi:hypothetical protein